MNDRYDVTIMITMYHHHQLGYTDGILLLKCTSSVTSSIDCFCFSISSLLFSIFSRALRTHFQTLATCSRASVPFELCLNLGFIEPTSCA